MFRLLLIINLLILISSGCKPKPEEIVKDYINFVSIEKDASSAYSLLCEDDKKYRTEEEFKKFIPKSGFTSLSKDQIQINILETTAYKDTAKVKVQIIQPDHTGLIHKMMSYYMLSALSKETFDDKERQIEEKLSKLLNEENELTKSEIEEYTVIKENNEYKLFLNLGLPHKIKKIKKRLYQLNNEAENAFMELKFEKAKHLYRKMQALEYSLEVQDKLEKIENFRKIPLKYMVILKWEIFLSALLKQN